jgi:hypothetical protein
MDGTYQNGDIDLWAIKSAITRVKFPFNPTRGGKVVESFLEAGLCTIPCLDLTHVLVRPGGKLQFEGETERAIEGAQEIEEIGDFLLDLILATDCPQSI